MSQSGPGFAAMLGLGGGWGSTLCRRLPSRAPSSLSLDFRCALFQVGPLFPECTYPRDVPRQKMFGTKLDWLPRKEVCI